MFVGLKAADNCLRSKSYWLLALVKTDWITHDQNMARMTRVTVIQYTRPVNCLRHEVLHMWRSVKRLLEWFFPSSRSVRKDTVSSKPGWQILIHELASCFGPSSFLRAWRMASILWDTRIERSGLQLLDRGALWSTTLTTMFDVDIRSDVHWNINPAKQVIPHQSP